ncbi:5,10-methylenetetrahydrofolate reductase [Planctomonas sp. JC2975]|uniref:methylenetetrahydrofolate reductase n=1 Tax=Planctomonas sp. JC2975 TaxID=2729626 RepID=UPI001473A541|nr:methylenetetrahydrofolate reductase [Planctomonas sp. JC2975]NNC13367.1 5,10-methylenetetrahydrofolate reductase [Planctomonas sp. JC2975]
MSAHGTADGVAPCPAGTPFSFELYPPRTEAASRALPDTISQLASAGPDFMAVTYGAGGSSHDSSLDVVRRIVRDTSVPVMAHLTCIGSSHEQAARMIREFLDAGVTRFLAVRGDPPVDAPADAPLGDLKSAAELVQLIHRIQAERAPYREIPLLGLPHASVVGKAEKVTIAVGAFPNGHPRSRSRSQDIDTLLAKQAAGANLAITQMFFHAEDYFAFVDRARVAGVTFPILPGLMPATTPTVLRRMLDLSGEDLPSELGIRLEVEPTDEGRREIGIDYAARLAERLVAGGAPGIHLYTFGRPRTALSVLERCGLVDTAAVGS